LPRREGGPARLLRRPGDEADRRQGEPAGRQRAPAREAAGLTSADRGKARPVEPIEQHMREVERGRSWWTPFAAQGWVFLAVALVTAIVIAAATIAYLIA